MRPVSSCLACRASKRKCRVRKANVACTRCAGLGLACNLSARGVGSTSHAEDDTSLPQPIKPTPLRPLESHVVEDCFLEPALCKELVSLYFTEIHDKHHSIFHQPSIDANLTNETLPDILLFAMMGLGVRFSDASLFAHMARRYRGRGYAERARQLLNLADISIVTVQACILLGTLAFSESHLEAEALYYSVAIRLALILDLPRRPVESIVEKQVDLRVWWSLYMIDIWGSTGLSLPRQLQFDEDLPLPLDETLFLRMQREDSVDIAEGTFGRGIWAEMARLARIWADIHQVNKAFVDGCMSSDMLNDAVNTLRGQLQDWDDSLPPGLKETRSNLERHASFGLGTAFAALRLGYHYYNEVLLYQFLAENDHNSSVSTSLYAQHCRDHAVKFCDLLYMCNEIQGCECRYIMVGHMLVVTSTVYIHMLLFSAKDAQLDIVRERLQGNFKVLTKLQTYWVTLDASLSRLKVFHNTCLNSIEKSFCMDRWMLKFILEHGVALTEKDPAAMTETNAAGQAVEETLTPASPWALQDWYLQTFSLESMSSGRLD